MRHGVFETELGTVIYDHSSYLQFVKTELCEKPLGILITKNAAICKKGTSVFGDSHFFQFFQMTFFCWDEKKQLLQPSGTLGATSNFSSQFGAISSPHLENMRCVGIFSQLESPYSFVLMLTSLCDSDLLLMAYDKNFQSWVVLFRGNPIQDFVKYSSPLTHSFRLISRYHYQDFSSDVLEISVPDSGVFFFSIQMTNPWDIELQPMGSLLHQSYLSADWKFQVSDHWHKSDLCIASYINEQKQNVQIYHCSDGKIRSLIYGKNGVFSPQVCQRHSFFLEKDTRLFVLSSAQTKEQIILGYDKKNGFFLISTQGSDFSFRRTMLPDLNEQSEISKCSPDFDYWIEESLIPEENSSDLFVYEKNQSNVWYYITIHSLEFQSGDSEQAVSVAINKAGEIQECQIISQSACHRPKDFGSNNANIANMIERWARNFTDFYRQKSLSILAYSYFFTFDFYTFSPENIMLIAEGRREDSHRLPVLRGGPQDRRTHLRRVLPHFINSHSFSFMQNFLGLYAPFESQLQNEEVTIEDEVHTFFRNIAALFRAFLAVQDCEEREITTFFHRALSVSGTRDPTEKIYSLGESMGVLNFVEERMASLRGFLLCFLVSSANLGVDNIASILNFFYSNTILDRIVQKFSQYSNCVAIAFEQNDYWYFDMSFKRQVLFFILAHLILDQNVGMSDKISFFAMDFFQNDSLFPQDFMSALDHLLSFELYSVSKMQTLNWRSQFKAVGSRITERFATDKVVVFCDFTDSSVPTIVRILGFAQWRSFLLGIHRKSGDLIRDKTVLIPSFFSMITFKFDCGGLVSEFLLVPKQFAERGILFLNDTRISADRESPLCVGYKDRLWLQGCEHFNVSRVILS